MSSTARVTVGIDRSEPALLALDWAVDYARTHKTPLRIVTSVEMPLPMPAFHPFRLRELEGQAELSARRVVDQALDRCRAAAPDLDARGAVLSRPPIPALLDASKISDLVVVGSRGLNPLRYVLLGSVSAAVAAHAYCPVVVVRSARRAGPDDPVVVGIDCSDGDDATLAAAFDAASSANAPLIVLHAWSDLALVAEAGAAMAGWLTWDDLQKAETERVLRQTAAWAGEYPGVRLETRVIREAPAAALTEMASSAGLIVVGSHGRGGFAGMLLGSVARRLLHHADCPVMVVRHPAPTKEHPEEESCAPAIS